ncbi:hypothetical protein M431DRAFT_383292 [Trichoderma harzianum CBS 226.95]|uniref:Uncharacterized protein n=1 Tax=Trichoderma harzianum CBS 226.95 TaxID=983964 RepID=A0A2T4AHV6_TRIHA|nr:hypothetical protein M431DRAFT_383292 [Trichoderma harzianum CBS 226.95]PTB56633.1 hypothetical protein M431DRAFT_383292 [Trichoderma harzianum CBS 226.95]
MGLQVHVPSSHTQHSATTNRPQRASTSTFSQLLPLQVPTSPSSTLIEACILITTLFLPHLPFPSSAPTTLLCLHRPWAAILR